MHTFERSFVTNSSFLDNSLDEFFIEIKIGMHAFIVTFPIFFTPKTILFSAAERSALARPWILCVFVNEG